MLNILLSPLNVKAIDVIRLQGQTTPADELQWLRSFAWNLGLDCEKAGNLLHSIEFFAVVDIVLEMEEMIAKDTADISLRWYALLMCVAGHVQLGRVPNVSDLNNVSAKTNSVLQSLFFILCYSKEYHWHRALHYIERFRHLPAVETSQPSLSLSSASAPRFQNVQLFMHLYEFECRTYLRQYHQLMDIAKLMKQSKVPSKAMERNVRGRFLHHCFRLFSMHF